MIVIHYRVVSLREPSETSELSRFHHKVCGGK